MTVEQIQHLLVFLGYGTGGTEGIYGPKTTQAVRDFQEEFGGLSVDGQAGADTQAALRQAIGDGWTRPEKKAENGPELGTGWDKIKYFRQVEFACKCGQYCDGFPVDVDLGMVAVMDKIREEIGKPIRINSGIRCKRHNTNVGGVSNSTHLVGNACDAQKPAGTTPEQMAAIAEKYLPNSGGIGIYAWGIHVDTRAAKARWKG